MGPWRAVPQFLLDQTSSQCLEKLVDLNARKLFIESDDAHHGLVVRTNHRCSRTGQRRFTVA